jgi:hypothetical protein
MERLEEAARRWAEELRDFDPEAEIALTKARVAGADIPDVRAWLARYRIDKAIEEAEAWIRQPTPPPRRKPSRWAPGGVALLPSEPDYDDAPPA